MSHDDGDAELPPSEEEIQELRRELRTVREQLTAQLHVAMQLSTRLTDIVVRLLRAVR